MMSKELAEQLGINYLPQNFSPLFSGVGIIFYMKKDSSLERERPISALEELEVPKNSSQKEKPLNFEKGSLSLQFAAPRMTLPNLRSELVFHGTSERPDFTLSNFYFSLAGSEALFSHAQGKPLYLVYKKEAQTASGFEEKEGRYVISDVPTNLWVDFVLQNGGKKLAATVHMLDENGVEIEEESANREFFLMQVPISKEKVGSWELGDLRVDSTLLIRQKARWIGADQFLQMHGGEEFSYVLGRERIDFMATDPIYSCFVKRGDMLIWKEGKWSLPAEGEMTQTYPLLVVRKIEEKVISFDLWDAEGKTKIPLNLIRSRDMGGMPHLEQEFRFVGAKTWAQFIVEAGRERFTIKPFDWLVLTAEGWVKLDSSEKIDAFITQKVVGPLLVLDKMGKQAGKQVITGHLFNSSRTEVLPVELNIASSAYSANSAPFYFKPQPLKGEDP